MPLQKVLIVSNTDLNILLFRRALVKALLDKGLEVHVCVPRGMHGDELMELGAALWHYPLARGSLNPVSVPPSFKVMRELIGFLKPDVIHSFTHQANILVRFGTQGKAKVVHTITGLGSGFLLPGVKGFAMRSFFKLLYVVTSGRCHALVFQNEADKAYFERNGLVRGANSLCIKGSGVDTNRFRPGLGHDAMLETRGSLGLSPEHVVCTMTARLLYDKGVMEFAWAARKLSKLCPQARFLIVGESDPGNSRTLSREDMDMLRQQPNLTLTGWRDDMTRLWCLSDIGVLPSYREGLPMSLQEAMACGLPVVTTDVPGCREIVNGGGHGVLVPLGNVDALVNALKELIENKERRKAMGKASREKAVRDFDGQKIAQEHISLYEHLLAG